MKGIKGKFLRKLKFISTVTTLKQGLVIQVNPSNQNFQTSTIYKDQEHKNHHFSEIANDVKEEGFDSNFNSGDRGNFPPSIKSQEMVPSKEKLESRSDNDLTIPLNSLQEKCPPGGIDSVILYTTSLRGIRKTFEDCNAIRFLLESFRVLFQERDVSMHLEFREELWNLSGGRVVPPRLFIGGKYVGGADEVVELHEKGNLKNLLKGIPIKTSNGPCEGCAGARFTVCPNCNGSRRIVTDRRADELPMRCPECNENGLIKCSICII